MKVKAPNDVVEYIKEKFTLAMGKVIKHDGTVPSFTIINKRNYSMSYIKDVLEGRDPDLSVLFDIKDGKLYRNQDPVWAMFKGTKVSEKGAKVCGVLITQDGIRGIPQESTVATKATKATKATLALEPLVVSEYVKEYIKDRFRLRNREVVYIKGDKPFGNFMTIEHMRYSKGYVQQVLEGKDPDISDLFELRDGVICRSQDPLWGSFKGKPVVSTNVCGVLVTKEGFQILEEKPREPTPGPDDYYKAVEVPEHIKLLINHKFKMIDDEVYFKRETTASGAPKKLNFARLVGRVYASSYVLSVLKGEKPNLETLFTIKDGFRYRNNDPVWQTYKGTRVNNPSSICGELVPGKVSSPSITRAGDFDWLADMEKRSTPGAKYDYAYSYKGEEPTLAHRINGVIYSTGFIDRMKAGETFTQGTRPPIPAYLFKKVRLDFGDGSEVVMTSDDDVWRRNKLEEILELECYIINGFLYEGEDIIKKVSRTKSCTWSWEEFYDIAKFLYPDNELVANIKLDDSEFTGEM